MYVRVFSHDMRMSSLALCVSAILVTMIPTGIIVTKTATDMQRVNFLMHAATVLFMVPVAVGMRGLSVCEIILLEICEYIH